MVEAEGRLALAGQSLPMGPHRLQQLEGAIHLAGDVDAVRRAGRAVGLRALDRAVHVALGRQVQHQIGIGLAHRCRRGLGVGEVHFEGLVAALALGGGGPLAQLRQHLPDAGEIAGAAALAEVQDQRLAVCEQTAHHGPADVDASRPEAIAGTAGHQDVAAAGEQGGNLRRGGGGHGRRRTRVLE